MTSAEDPRGKVQDIQFEEMWEALFDRHYAIVALVTLCPKKGEPWTEERMLLWVEIVEKTARLIYGLRSDWDFIGAAPSKKEPEPEDDPPPPEPVQPAVPKPAEAGRLVEQPKPKAATPVPKQPRQREDGELDAAVLELLTRSNVTLRRREIAARLGASDSTLTDVLARLRAAGKIERLGTSSDVSYDVARKRKEPISASCTAPDCILAAVPGTDRCGQHAEAVLA